MAENRMLTSVNPYIPPDGALYAVAYLKYVLVCSFTQAIGKYESLLGVINT